MLLLIYNYIINNTTLDRVLSCDLNKPELPELPEPGTESKKSKPDKEMERTELNEKRVEKPIITIIMEPNTTTNTNNTTNTTTNTTDNTTNTTDNTNKITIHVYNHGVVKTT